MFQVNRTCLYDGSFQEFLEFRDLLFEGSSFSLLTLQLIVETVNSLILESQLLAEVRAELVTPKVKRRYNNDYRSVCQSYIKGVSRCFLCSEYLELRGLF